MKRAMILLGLLPALALAGAADGADAKGVLEKTIEALRATKAVRYDGRFEATGPLASQFGKLSGKVALQEQEAADAPVPLLRLDVQVTAPGATEPGRLELAHDGKQITLLNHAKKKFIEESMPGGMSLLPNIATIVASEYFVDGALTEEIAAKSLSLDGKEKIGDVECHVVKVVYGNDERGPVTYHIGTADHLPRKISRIYKGQSEGDADSVLTLTLENLDAKYAPKPADWQVERPAGYVDEIAASNPSMLPVESEAPDWTLKTPDGKSVSLKELRGKVVVMDFWATWCGPCKMAMPGLQKLHEKYKGQPVQIIGVSCRERSGAKPEKYMEEKNFTYMLLVDGTEVAQKYKVGGIPAFYVIGQDGKVVWASAGYSPANEEKLERMIDRELKAAVADQAEKKLEKAADQPQKAEKPGA